MDKNIKNKNIKNMIIDITAVELMPGEPTACLGNGEQGFECCCDECDYYLLCFPEIDSESKEENIAMNIEDCIKQKNSLGVPAIKQENASSTLVVRFCFSTYS